MATKNNNERDFVRCIDCKHAILMQWYENPIVAQCRELRERMVAQSKRVCKLFEASQAKEKDIQHFDDYSSAREAARHEFYDGATKS